MKEYAITFDPERCIACHGCVVACRSWRDTPPNAARRSLIPLWRNDGNMPRLLHASAACMHCASPACLKACPTGAIHKDGNGVVLVDENTCVGCRACLKACPFRVPQFAARGGSMIKCDLCSGLFTPETQSPPCVATCPTGALTFTLLSKEEKESAEADFAALIGQAEQA